MKKKCNKKRDINRVIYINKNFFYCWFLLLRIKMLIYFIFNDKYVI